VTATAPGTRQLHKLLAMRDSRPRNGEGARSEAPTVTPVLVAELLAEGERMPVYVQRRELDDARSEEDYTIREWVDAPGVQYVPVDGALDLLPGLRLVPAPGHTRGSQVVVLETGGRSVVVGGDMAVFFAELDEPRTEGQRLVRALDPDEVWLSHEHEPWRPQADQHV
jgi:N-acyl homoserine lactone hydrolase